MKNKQFNFDIKYKFFSIAHIGSDGAKIFHISFDRIHNKKKRYVRSIPFFFLCIPKYRIVILCFLQPKMKNNSNFMNNCMYVASDHAIRLDELDRPGFDIDIDHYAEIEGTKNDYQTK